MLADIFWTDLKSQMKNKLLWFLFGSLFVTAIFWVKRSLYLISTSDPDYNTVYSSKYEEQLFNKNLLGENENELIQLLGEPLYRYKMGFVNKLLYAENKDSIYLDEDCNCVRFKEHPRNKNYTCFYIDSIGNVNRVKRNKSNLDSTDYSHFTKADILKKFGNPNDEILNNCQCEVLSFSTLTKGTQSGKLSTIYVRQVVINRNKVVTKIIKKVADMYHPTLYYE